MKRLLSFAWATMALVAAARPASAHPVPFSYLDLRVQHDTIEAVLVAHIFDAAHDLNVSPIERLLDPAVLAAQSPALVALMSGRLHVYVDGQLLMGEWSRAEPLPGRPSVQTRVRYRPPGPAGSGAVAAVLYPYDPVHQTFVNVYSGSGLAHALTDRNR